jgi:hypothetical protein
MKRQIWRMQGRRDVKNSVRGTICKLQEQHLSAKALFYRVNSIDLHEVEASSIAASRVDGRRYRTVSTFQSSNNRLVSIFTNNNRQFFFSREQPYRVAKL